MVAGSVDEDDEDGFNKEDVLAVAFEARELLRSVAQGGSSSAAGTSMRGGGDGILAAAVRQVFPGQQHTGLTQWLCHTLETM